MLRRLFRSRTARVSGADLYARAVAQARDERFYLQLGAPDQIDARFELYTLHVLLLSMRLHQEGANGADAAQDLFDAYVSALDHSLRELGVGDLSMSAKMRKLGGQLYGRMTAYETPLKAGDRDVLIEVLTRNLYGDADSAGAGTIADYALASRASLAAQSLAAVLAAPAWAEIKI